MNKEFTPASRPTFKRTLRRISVISVVITMTIIWLLLSVASVVTLKQYAQKNLELTSATLSRSLEAALVFNDAVAATETLATLGKQGQFDMAEVIDRNHQPFARWTWKPKNNPDTFNTFISHWLFPVPVTHPVWHNGTLIGEVRITARDNLIGHFIWLSFAVLTGSILLTSLVALTITRSLHNGVVAALQNITDVVHDVRTNRDFTRRVSEERIEEFHRFGQDFNSLLDEMEEWQLKLQAKNAQLLRTAMHDPLTGLANRAAFRNALASLMNDSPAKSSAALLFLDGDNFKAINDTWGHAAGDCVLIEVASRMVEFGGKRHPSFRLGGDEFAMILYGVHSRSDVQKICSGLTHRFLQPFNLHNGESVTLTLSVGFALAWENESVEKLLEQADRHMYRIKNQRPKVIS
ncbi:diguanylate cyclase DgcN [Pseudenterobacter timonensis]|uniref:diguanylate cyclase DgcN n=1 Tax=Pseudenterobacter timonensis TaxID=1755099 RepID=UPI00077B844E|nr:diguanylate cyclase DgcN [Pseudenterobacter timonensis]